MWVAAAGRLTQAGGTRIDLALATARAELVGLRHMAGNNRVVVLLTDGEPSSATPQEVRGAAGLLVFTIGLGKAVDQLLLRDVASNPAWYFASPDTRNLAAIYGQIAYEILCRPMWK